MKTLYLLDDFAQHFNFIYANTGALKRESYQLRSQATGTECNHSLSSQARLDIDQYDAHSHHILLQDKNTKNFVATARIIEPPVNNPNKLLPVEENNAENIWISGVAIRTLPKRSYSEMSRLSISPDYKPHKDNHCGHDKIILGLCLASFSLARLLFHQYMFARLTVDQFKKLRASGLLLEQTNERIVNHDKSAVFYLNLESGIKQTNPVYELQQHVLNEIAHQLNNPVVKHSNVTKASSVR
jgi:N-acyl amino acid synthase of PEP-CTERM/exosortase system